MYRLTSPGILKVCGETYIVSDAQISTYYCCTRKRPHVDVAEEKEDVTVACTPQRRVIKLTSVKELRNEIAEQAHKGKIEQCIVHAN